MPSYEYNHLHKAFVKTCSCCKKAFIGTDENDSSFEIFLKHFSVSRGRAQTADGLQSRCWTCNNSKRRELGITREQLEQLHKNQKGCCAICSKNISIEKDALPSIHAHVDHNDDTGVIRELLCGNCNRGIGLFNHDPNKLRSAITYLNKHSNIVSLMRRA